MRNWESKRYSDRQENVPANNINKNIFQYKDVSETILRIWMILKAGQDIQDHSYNILLLERFYKKWLIWNTKLLVNFLLRIIGTIQKTIIYHIVFLCKC